MNRMETNVLINYRIMFTKRSIEMIRKYQDHDDDDHLVLLVVAVVVVPVPGLSWVHATVTMVLARVDLMVLPGVDLVVLARVHLMVLTTVQHLYVDGCLRGLLRVSVVFLPHVCVTPLPGGGGQEGGVEGGREEVREGSGA